MSFHNEQEMRAAMAWFRTNGLLLPKVQLLNSFEDDHSPCLEVQFGDVFKFNFNWLTMDGVWMVARSDVDRQAAKDTWNMIVSTIEDDASYSFESGEGMGTDEQQLDEALFNNLQVWKTQVENAEV